jgi:pilus assembly protein FimV
VLTTIKNLSTQRPLGHQSGAESGTRRSKLWRTPVAAAAMALLLGLAAVDAHALALGRVNVLSALGEPLRAEIEVPDINAEEAATLKTNVASGDAFRAAGLEFNPALSNLQISLQRRPNGSAYLRLSSDKPINEPFVDLILETSWSTGRVVRDYTMLFDPSNMRTQPAAAINTAPNVASNNAPGQASPRAVSPAPYVPPAVSAPSRTTPSRERAAPRVLQAPVAKSKPGSVTVKAGNTATQIAVRYKPPGVSLDQMLVALLDNNPEAFVDGNINRLKKGAVLDIPDAGFASATPPDQARQTITAQSKDFNDFRRRLARGVPTANAPMASRKAAGNVQANVQERKPTASAPDKLTLSKGAVAAASAASAKASKEEAIAKDKQAKDAAARTAELSKNIQDLNKLVTPTVATPTAKAAPSAAAPAASSPGVALPTGAVTPVLPKVTATAAAPAVTATTATTAAAVKPSAPAALTPTAAATATAPAATKSAVVAASATAASAAAAPASAPVAAVKPAVLPAPPAPEPSMVDSLMDNPLTLPATGGLLAALVGFGVYRMRKRKTSSQVDSSFLESRLQPDSFFGASGGQRVDTNDAGGPASGSSMVYSPSQLDAAGDVDPVAEADVYLAYGRDLQAEEILKEAMRTNPSRVAIHAKLMEIYAKRRDLKAFETVANEAYSVTKGQGAEWEAAAALGRDIDPANPLYQGAAGSATLSTASKAAAVGAAGMVAAGAAAFTGAASAKPAAAADDNDVDFDLDLDFSSGDDNHALSTTQSLHTSTSPIHVQSTVALKPQPSLDSAAMDLVFDSPDMPDLSGTNSGLIDLSPPDLASFDQKLSFPEPKMSQPGSAPTAPMSFATAPSEPSMDALEFDLGDLSLDLPSSSAGAASATHAVDAELSGDPLDTKLALAQEFREIGDNDGARALAQEVAAEATGALKARAQRMVADLS